MLAARFAQAWAAHQAGDLALAQRLYREILAAEPAHVDALHLLGVAELQQGRAAAALELIDRALQAAPQPLAALHLNRAAALRDLGRAGAALDSLDRALALQPDEPKALNNHAAALLDLGRAAEALASVERSLRLDARDPAAHNNHGNALLQLGRAADALSAYDRALALDARPVITHANRGNALLALGRADEAVAAFDAALQREPGQLQALTNRGHALLELGRPDAAQQSYRRALDIAPDVPFRFGHWLDAKLKGCDWAGLDDAFTQLARGIDAGLPIAAPFVALHAPLSAAQQQRCAQAFVQARHPARVAPPEPVSSGYGRIRIGYFSADFRLHATAHLAAGLFERHRRDRFEVTAFVFGPPSDDAMRTRLRAAFERFVDVSALPDIEVVALARRLGTQIAVDLGGFTQHARPGVFEQRAAPLQIGWLGYPGTTAAPFIDYLVADATVIPHDQRAHYSEKVVRLPHSYQVNDALGPLAPAPPREALGLPAEAFVFCCFNQPAKITPDVFAVWMRMLLRVPGSVLWLLHGNDDAAAQLRRMAQERGVDPQRLVFAPRLAWPQHVARQAAADLFIDTWHYTAHTTASDALRAGLPVLTLLGQTFAARVAASLLHAVGLPELVAQTPADYEARALALATTPLQVADLRRRLLAQRETAPLFEPARFTRRLEAAYSALWQRHHFGLPPADLQVGDDLLGDGCIFEDAPMAEAAGRMQPRIDE